MAVINIVGVDPCPGPWNMYGTPYVFGRRAFIIDCDPETNVETMVGVVDGTFSAVEPVIKGAKGYCDAYDDAQHFLEVIQRIGKV